MFITGWSMFQKCHLCIVPEPIWNCSHLWQLLPFFLFLFLEQSMVIWPPNWFDLHGCPAIDLIRGVSVSLTLFLWRSTGLPLKTCHFFYIFAPCHQIRMRCSDHCSSLQASVGTFLFSIITKKNYGSICHLHKWKIILKNAKRKKHTWSVM